ncbi:MAG: acyltransferase, partial [Alphaproteobacteria bacterium]|nr:acyltransferase [Alphaproteobacteria bacterium]
YLDGSYFSVWFGVLRKLSGWVYGFHMPLFFMLSGAVLNLKPLKEFDAFCLTKIKRLIIPFFVYGFLFMLPVKFLGRFYTATSILPAYRAFSGGGESGHLWFLPALFWCMIAFVSLRKILLHFNINSVGILLLIAGLIQLTYKNLPFDFFSLKSGLSYIFYFAAGYSFELVREKVESVPKNILVLLFFFYTLILYIDYQYSVFGKFANIFVRSFWIVLLSRVCGIFFDGVYNSNLFQILNRNLFNIYLFHDPLDYIFLRLFFSNRLCLLKYSGGVCLYYFSRVFGVIIVSVLLGEFVRYFVAKISYVCNQK